jgi:hypothetical protein
MIADEPMSRRHTGRRIPTSSQGRIDTLQHESVEPFIEGDLPPHLIDRLRQVKT